MTAPHPHSQRGSEPHLRGLGVSDRLPGWVLSCEHVFLNRSSEHAHNKASSAPQSPVCPGRASPTRRTARASRWGRAPAVGPQAVVTREPGARTGTGPEGPPWSPCPSPRRQEQSVSGTEPARPCAQPACVTGHVDRVAGARTSRTVSARSAGWVQSPGHTSSAPQRWRRASRRWGSGRGSGACLLVAG